MTFAELILVNALAAWFEVAPAEARLLWLLYRHGGPLTQPAWADLAGMQPSCISVYLTHLRKPLGHDAFVTGRPGPNSRRLDDYKWTANAAGVRVSMHVAKKMKAAGVRRGFPYDLRP